MIAVLRVRFDTNNDLGSVWSDDVTTAWMQPLRPWSLGHYWMTASHGLLSLQSTVWPAVVMPDPRKAGGDNKTNRTLLTQAAADAGTTQRQVDWDQTDVLVLVFAQPTDLFGDGSASVPPSGGGTKSIPVTVVDSPPLSSTAARNSATASASITNWTRLETSTPRRTPA